MAQEKAYTFYIHTGCYYPQIKSTTKWSDGSMMITINPGSPTTSSEVIIIEESFSGDHEGCAEVDFWLPASIGPPQLLRIDLQSNNFEVIKDALFIREVAIAYDEELYRFPVKNYLYPHSPIIGNPDVPLEGCQPHFLIRAGGGSLPQHETEKFIIEARNENLQYMRSMIPWSEPLPEDSPLVVPSHIGITDYEKVPRFLKFKDSYLDAFQELRSKGRKAMMGMLLGNKVKKFFGSFSENSFQSFQHCLSFYREMSDKMSWCKTSTTEGTKVAAVFELDEEFGRQFLQGPSPMNIRKITTLPPRWEAGVGKLPDHALEGNDLADMMSQGRVFEISHSDVVEGVPHGGAFSKKLTGTKQTWYIFQADCMLYIRNDNKIVPVLIRLENKNDGQKESFWCPPAPSTDKKDPEYLSWLLAKMYFNSMDYSQYSICVHFARGHAINEVFAVSAFRNLPMAHPIFRLLQPHIQGIVSINVQGRTVLVNPGMNAFGSFLSCGDNLFTLMSNDFKKLTYKSLLVPEEFESRGVGEIPNFLFRDDASEIWRILHEYVTEFVDLVYTSDGELEADVEMKSFTEEVVDIGFRRFENGAGFPRHLTTRAALSDYLTAVISNISVFHTGVNFQIYQYLAFTPNYPPSLRLPPPDEGEVITEERIMTSLPTLETAFFTMNIVNLLGNFSPIERFYVENKARNRLGLVGDHALVAEDQVTILSKMTRQMEELKRKIDERNKGKYMKYTVLRPDNIPVTTQT